MCPSARRSRRLNRAGSTVGVVFLVAGASLIVAAIATVGLKPAATPGMPLQGLASRLVRRRPGSLPRWAWPSSATLRALAGLPGEEASAACR